MSVYRTGGLFLLLSVLWGTAFMAIKAGLAFIPPVLFAAFRYDVAGIIMLGYVVSTLLGSDTVATGFVFLAAVCVALGSVLVQRIDGDLSTEGMVAWSNALGAILLHILSLALPSESLVNVDVTTSSLLAVVYLGVFASAVGYFIYFLLLDRLGAIEINLISYAAPVFAAASGWLVLGEQLEPLSIAGFLVIVAGFGLVKHEALRDQVLR